MEDFDFSLDPSLKKIRNVWKEFQKSFKSGTFLQSSSSSCATPPGPKNPALQSTRAPEEASSPRSPPKSPSKPNEPIRSPLKFTEATKTSPKPTVCHSLPGGSGLVGWDDERGVRCTLTNCNKLFRNDKLLLQHVKVRIRFQTTFGSVLFLSLSPAQIIPF